ncbi:MAG: flagellar basal body rod protein FlgB [Chloroflexi bacterium]|nr:flagellar basal body rod protein FlgB [Chloroflexota bacterium]
MINGLFDDPAMQSAKMALDGLALRNQIISRNLANVDTPGYKAQSVDFESVIRRAIDRETGLSMDATQTGHIGKSSGSAASATLIRARAGGSTRADGNNVDVDNELIEMSETGIRYEAVSQQVSKKLLLLKSIAASR